MSIRLIILLAALASSIACQKELIQGEILIQGSLVYTGQNEAPKRIDIIIESDYIKWIGDSNKITAHVDRVIDAQEYVVTPGFIDIHAHGNPLEHPDFSNFLAMGVTTIALGMDGSGVPVVELDSWINEVNELRTGVNILPFLGHGTERRAVHQGSGVLKNAELQEMLERMKDGMELGAWGVSFGLEYLPGYYADQKELEGISKIVGEYKGLITSHIRNEDNDAIEESLMEMIELSDHCNVNISHLKVVYGQGGERANEILNLIQSRNLKNFKVTADLYPYSASYTGIGIVFPEWAKNPKLYAQIKKERGDELAAHLKRRVEQRNGPQATLFGSGPYKGRTLKEVADEFDLPFEIVLRDIIGPYGASAAYFVMNDELQAQLFQSPFVAVASDGSPTMYHPRGHGTFAKVLQEYVLQDSLASLEEAIHKMTVLPASIVGIEKRGEIAIGQKADLLIFKPEEIRNNASFEEPHQLATGMEHVIVNGKIVDLDTGDASRHGKVLLRK